MSGNISLVETSQIEDKVQKILRQTDYSEETAREKLSQHNYDEIQVIKSYLGIAEKKAPSTVKSLNQEIYKQLRYKLDTNMRDYQERAERGDTQKII